MSVRFYVEFIFLADPMCASVNHTGLEQTVVQLCALCKLHSTILPKWLQHNYTVEPPIVDPPR